MECGFGINAVSRFLPPVTPPYQDTLEQTHDEQTMRKRPVIKQVEQREPEGAVILESGIDDLR